MILHIILTHLGMLKVIIWLDVLNHIHKNVPTRQHSLVKRLRKKKTFVIQGFDHYGTIKDTISQF